MTKILISLAIFCAASIALGDSKQTVSFSCTSQDNLDAKEPVTVKFQLAVNAKGKFEYVNPDVDEIFEVDPKDSSMNELNENGSIRQDGEKVTFFGDGDGFVLVYLTLYKDSGYHTGFARVVDQGAGVGNHYSVVICKNDL